MKRLVRLAGLALALLLATNAPPVYQAPAGGQEFTILQFAEVANLGAEISDLEFAADGRRFIVQRNGLVRLALADWTVLPEPFLDLSDRFTPVEELGLASLALHPQFATNGRFYVSYTDDAWLTHLATFTVAAGDPNQADPASESDLLTLQQPSPIHNGGEILFGPEGALYVALGDGGGFSDPYQNGQNGQSLLGKILRLDVDNGQPYAIPADNPFVSDDHVLDEIWALGLRNPWRISFDRLTGDLYVGDVGEARWEEVNVEPAGSGGGLNYGWRCYEGNYGFLLDGCQEPAAYTFPIDAFPHPSFCALIGGFVYRGSQMPALSGHYLLADYCSGDVWTLRPDGDGGWWRWLPGRTPAPGLITFGQDAAGELYAAASGRIYGLSTTVITLPPRMYLPLVWSAGF